MRTKLQSRVSRGGEQKLGNKAGTVMFHGSWHGTLLRVQESYKRQNLRIILRVASEGMCPNWNETCKLGTLNA